MTGAIVVALESWRLAWLSELSRRASFWIQLVLMVVNDLVWIVFWLLVFSHRDSIRGWERDEVLVLYAIIATAFGLGVGLFYGTRRLGDRIRRRELDPYLVQPRPVVLRVLFEKIHPPMLGDVAFGPVLFALAGPATIAAWGRFVLVAVLAAAIVVAFVLAWESLSFWLESGREVAGVAFTSMIVLATYPAAIYSGVVKLVVFTALPAAFIGSIPAEVVLDPSWTLLGALAGAAAAAWAIALATFHAGLRRYLRSA